MNFEKVRDFFMQTKSDFEKAWANMDSTDHTIFLTAVIVIFLGFMAGGIITEGAVFAVSMMLVIVQMLVQFTGVLRFLALHRKWVDLFIGGWLLIVGFLTGSVTFAVGMVFLGLCVSAFLRSCQGFWGRSQPSNQ
jgi:hypothetical protein